MFNAVWVSVLAEIMRRIGLKTQSVMCKLYWLAFHACHVGAFAGDCALQVIQRTACCKNQLNRLHNINHTQNCLIRGCAYKSLARPRRKKTTETKLGIYSTHSHEAQYTSQPVAVSFASHLKKIRSLSVQPGLCGSNDLCVGRKMATLQWFFFSVQGTCGSPTGPGPENRVCDQDIGSPGRPVSSGEQVTGAGALSCKNKTPLVTFPRPAFFLQDVLQLHQQRWVLLRVDSLVLWKIINEEDAVLIPKNRGENSSSGFLHSEFFGAAWAAMPPLHWLLLCLRVIVI